METLTANSGGFLKNAEGQTPTYRLYPGKRYALVIAGGDMVTGGEVYPAIDQIQIPGDATDSNNPVSWTCGTGAPVSFGCEFVATGTTLTIQGYGFTSMDTVSVSLVPIED